MTLRTEIPKPTLGDLVELTALIVARQAERFSRVAARLLLTYLEAVEDATVDEAAFVAASLLALAGRRHGHALSALRDMAEEASRRASRGCVP